MKRSWMQIASLALTAVLAVVVFWQGAQLDALERKLPPVHETAPFQLLAGESVTVRRDWG